MDVASQHRVVGRLAVVSVETVVALTGELDLTDADHVADRVAEAASGSEVVWIDARRLSFIDCAGVHALISAKERAEIDGASVTIQVSAASPVARVFDLMGLTERSLLAPPQSLTERQDHAPSPVPDDAARGNEVEHLRRAIESRDLIGQAKGLLMTTTGCSADAAFLLLRAQSQRENRKLVEIAREIVDLQRRSIAPQPVSELEAATAT